jgi:CTP synthase
MTKYIFVVGGVISGLGKGIATSTLGLLLKSRGLKVTAMKIDPYLNVDAGTMNPTEHGEVFVTKDGLETDQDIGNYERFLDTELFLKNYMTQGMVWKTVIEKERNLEYKGKCVSPWQHIPEEIIRRIKNISQGQDIVLIEVGGTVGEYENLIFLEAGRRMKLEMPESVIFILVSYLPIPSKVGEMKTKPTQNAVQTLNSAGIQPDFILARSEKPIDAKRKEKISFFCNIPLDNVISSEDVNSIYEVPLNYFRQELDKKILKKLRLKISKSNFDEWRNKIIKKPRNIKDTVEIAMIGKYFSTGDFTLSDSYISVIEAIKHAAWENDRHAHLTWIDAEEYEKNPKKLEDLKNYDGIVVPGGFGTRGTEGIIKAINFARKNKIPYLGLCYGMQLATVEFSRNEAKLKNANTSEINPKSPHQVIHVMPEQEKLLEGKNYGGTMRLGAYPCKIKKNTIAYKTYKKQNVLERHRHRYEFNNDYRDKLENLGLVISGTSPNNKLVEIIELSEKIHPFFVGVQFHPEFQSHPLNPHPIFVNFIKKTIK